MSDTNRRDIVEVLMDACCDFMMKGIGCLGPREWRAAASEILALREKTRWIPVSERLPEWGVPVIGWFPDAARPFECKLNEHDGVWSDSETGIHLHEHSRPSHWMPLPAPPKEEKP